MFSIILEAVKVCASDDQLHQHNYDFHTAVILQPPQTGSKHGNFISMRSSRCSLCLFLSPVLSQITNTLPGPTLCRTLNLPHVELHSLSHCLISQISFAPPLCPYLFLYSPRTNLAWGCVFSCLTCSNYSPCARWGLISTCHPEVIKLIIWSRDINQKCYLKKNDKDLISTTAN